jgi:type II secretory pathway component PulF
MQDKLPPQPSVLSRLIGIAAILLAHFLSLVALLFVFVKIVPTYTRVFEEAELALPAATVSVIRTSDIFVMYWYLIIFLGILLDGVVVALLAALPSRTNRLVSFYSHVWLLAVLFLLLWANVACVMPLISLVELNGANLAPAP